METTFVIKESDFNADFIETVKKLFKKKGQLQITIRDAEDFDLYKSETPDEFLARIEHNIKAVDEGKDVVVFDTASFDEFVKERL